MAGSMNTPSVIWNVGDEVGRRPGGEEAPIPKPKHGDPKTEELPDQKAALKKETDGKKEETDSA